MNCMNSILQKRLAGKLSLWDLNELHDKKDKLKSKLFMKKLEQLFDEEHNMLHRCVHCGHLYTGNQREWQQCSRSQVFINVNGQAISKHVSDKHWDINKFVMFLRSKQLGWQEIFWKMWARLQEFKCVTCDTKKQAKTTTKTLTNTCMYTTSSIYTNLQNIYIFVIIKRYKYIFIYDIW